MAANVWDVQRCTNCCGCVSLASLPGCSSFEFSDLASQSLRSAFPTGGLYGGERKIAIYRRGRRIRRPTVTRNLYSPLVESFGIGRHKVSHNLDSVKDTNQAGAWSASSIATNTRDAKAPSQHREQAEADVHPTINDTDNTPLDPVAARCGDETHTEKFADIGHNVDMKRGARTRPPSMSLSQNFSSVGRRTVSHTVGAVGHPLNNTKIKGPIGFVMALAVAALGFKTAVEKQGFGAPQKLCEKCDGYGVQQCHVCQGRGVLTWEGKLRHTDPCPLCFGRCMNKCSSCGGWKIKKGLPPSLLSEPLKIGASRKRD